MWNPKEDKTGQDKTRRLSPEELATLIAAAKAGDVPSEEQLQRRCRRFVNQARRSYILPPELAEEWIGQVWMILHRLIVEYDPSRGLPFFAYVAAKLPLALKRWVEQSRTKLRREQPIGSVTPSMLSEVDGQIARETEIPAYGYLEWMGLVGEMSVEDTAIVHVEFARALARLPGRRREVFRRLYEGESHAEIAEALGISEELSRREASRARRALQKALKDEVEEECHERDC